MCQCDCHEHTGMSRRDFFQAVGVSTAAGALAWRAVAPGVVHAAGRTKAPATVLGAFLYPSTEALRKEGYYSWPGSGFDAEGRQKAYTEKLGIIEKRLGIHLILEEEPLDTPDSVEQFIKKTQDAKPDGLLLIPFKKSSFGTATQILEQVAVPTVILASLGILLVDHIRPYYRRPGVYLINSEDNLNAVEQGLSMIRTMHRMKESLLLDLVGTEARETTVPHLGTTVRNIPLERFYATFAKIPRDDRVRNLAKEWLQQAEKTVEPSKEDVLEAAKCYYALKQILDEESGDALMMTCLDGLRHPHKHVPPCMGFMKLRDEGIPAGCQSDLNATLTLMLVQELFGLPGFQQNASMETERNHYFGAHCTSPSKMHGPNAPADPIILRNHAEAGWGCVPRVLFTKGQEVTLALYVAGDKPQMYVYTGTIINCPANPPTGGCRTNVEMTINEVEDVVQVKGMHQAVFYGNHGKALRQFCQMCGIDAVV